MRFSKAKPVSISFILIGVISFGFFGHAAALSLLGSVTLGPGENLLTGAVVDPVHGFAYFATDSSPDLIVKVRTSDLSNVGSLALPVANISSHGVIDVANGLAYFAAGKMVFKIDLSTFTIVGQLAVLSFSHFTVGVIDTVHGFAYFGNFIGEVSKIRLSDFTLVGTITIANVYVFTAVIDPAGGFAYFGVGSPDIFKVRLSDFTVVDHLGVGGKVGFDGAIIDTVHGFVYFSTSTIFKIDLTRFKVVDKLPMPELLQNITAPVIDVGRNVALYATFDSPASIVEISLSSFSIVNAITLQPGENNITEASAIDTGAGLAYFGTLTSPGIVVKIAD